MSKAKRTALISAAVIALVIILDQWLKIWVKTSFYLHESVEVLPFFDLTFVQNPGMAFGWEMGSKLLLTLFRFIATIFGFWYLSRLLRKKEISLGLCISIALILGGAIGNLIDCIFYGVIFNNPMPPAVATLFPAGGGYAPLLHGQVVDMFAFSFFPPIFNLADSAVSVGVALLILFFSDKLSLNEK